MTTENAGRETGPTAYPGALEPRIGDLYGEGHRTGYGPGAATCTNGALCAGCAEVRALSEEWDRRWREMDKRRAAR